MCFQRLAKLGQCQRKWFALLITLIKKDYRESWLLAGLERRLMPVTVISFKKFILKIVQDKPMTTEAFHSTTIHDKYEMHLHICNILFIIPCCDCCENPQNLLWMYLRWNLSFNILKLFQCYVRFSLDSWILSVWFFYSSDDHCLQQLCNPFCKQLYSVLFLYS